jgi:hypothetical protein
VASVFLKLRSDQLPLGRWRYATIGCKLGALVPVRLELWQFEIPANSSLRF